MSGDTGDIVARPVACLETACQIDDGQIDDGKTTILILGGTSEARQLAQWLSSFPCRVISSLAGRTQNPHMSCGFWRSGGFGGVGGLVKFLHAYHIRLIIDATHPFARKISAHARQAAQQTHIPLLHFERPAWHKTPQDNWIDVPDEVQAAHILPKMARVFLALGRQHLAAFASRRDVSFIARMVETLPQEQHLANLEIVAAPPQSATDEQHFLSYHKIDMLVSRNSGGLASYGKIVAARLLALPVVMICRPEPIYADTVTDLQHMQEKILEIILKESPCGEI